MKGFLFDENLPSKVTFRPFLPVTHARQVANRPTDTQLWDYARRHDLAIVSKDADFSHRVLSQQPPPRVVHLRIGNMRLKEFDDFMGRVWPRIEYLVAGHRLINVFIDRIEAVQ